MEVMSFNVYKSSSPEMSSSPERKAHELTVLHAMQFVVIFKHHLCVCKGVDLMRPGGYKTFFKLSTKFILVINVILLAF